MPLRYTCCTSPAEQSRTIEAKKTLAGKDFGELVRERRRQFGLPLPIAEKVLPFRPPSADAHMNAPLTDETADEPSQASGALARVNDAWQRLVVAEAASRPPKELDRLEEAFHAELARYHAVAGPPEAQG